MLRYLFPCMRALPWLSTAQASRFDDEHKSEVLMQEYEHGGLFSRTNINDMQTSMARSRSRTSSQLPTFHPLFRKSMSVILPRMTDFYLCDHCRCGKPTIISRSSCSYQRYQRVRVQEPKPHTPHPTRSPTQSDLAAHLHRAISQL